MQKGATKPTDMNNMRSSKLSLFLMELIIAILFFSHQIKGEIIVKNLIRFIEGVMGTNK